MNSIRVGCVWGEFVWIKRKIKHSSPLHFKRSCDREERRSEWVIELHLALLLHLQEEGLIEWDTSEDWESCNLFASTLQASSSPSSSFPLSRLFSLLKKVQGFLSLNSSMDPMFLIDSNGLFLVVDAWKPWLKSPS